MKQIFMILVLCVMGAASAYAWLAQVPASAPAAGADIIWLSTGAYANTDSRIVWTPTGGLATP